MTDKELADELAKDRGAIFAVLRESDVPDDCFAAIASITHARIVALRSEDKSEPSGALVERMRSEDYTPGTLIRKLLRYAEINEAKETRIHERPATNSSAEAFRQAAAALAAAPDGDGLLKVAQAFVAKLDECQPYIDSAFFQMHNHGMPHTTSPQYGEELDALRAAIDAHLSAQDQP